MDENRIGPFIAELRKEKKLTQKDLAVQLHITDKAVSKWERGLSCPDIALLAPLADILGVTTSELLRGQRSETAAPAAASADIEETLDHAFAYAESSAKRTILSFQTVLALSFSLLLLLGIMVCAICDVAISGAFTWSLYPISSILFAWFVFIPLIKYGRRGILGALVALSLLILPFLYGISRLAANHWIITIGMRLSLFSVAYLWCVYWLFRRLKEHKMRATAFSLLLVIPLCIFINLTLAEILSVSFFDLWDLLSCTLMIVSAVPLFAIDYYKTHKNPQ